AIAFDKTGTLTKGKPEVTDIVAREDLGTEQLLMHAVALERYSNHPLAAAIVKHAALDPTTLPKAVDMTDEAGFGVQAELNGVIWKIGKADFVGRADAEMFADQVGQRLAAEGKTIVYVRDDRGIAGVIALKDVIREQTRRAIDT